MDTITDKYDQLPVLHGEVKVPTIENPVNYGVYVPHPLTTILILSAAFVIAAVLVMWIERGLTRYRETYKNFYPDLPDPDRSTQREIHKAHKMAVYSARIRRQS